MESTLQKPAFVAGNTIPKATTILFWTFTGLFCRRRIPSRCMRQLISAPVIYSAP